MIGTRSLSKVGRDHTEQPVDVIRKLGKSCP